MRFNSILQFKLNQADDAIFHLYSKNSAMHAHAMMLCNGAKNLQESESSEPGEPDEAGTGDLEVGASSGTGARGWGGG